MRSLVCRHRLRLCWQLEIEGCRIRGEVLKTIYEILLLFYNKCYCYLRPRKCWCLIKGRNLWLKTYQKSNKYRNNWTNFWNSTIVDVKFINTYWVMIILFASFSLASGVRNDNRFHRISRHSLRRSSAIDSRELPSPLQPLLGDDACGEVSLPVPRQPSGNFHHQPTVMLLFDDYMVWCALTIIHVWL